MTQVIVTDREGRTRALDAPEGWRLMEILRDHEVGLEGLCGGLCDCATCHVELDEEWQARLHPPSEEELDRLAELPEVTAASRLSCQILWRADLDGLTLRLPEV